MKMGEDEDKSEDIERILKDNNISLYEFWESKRKLLKGLVDDDHHDVVVVIFRPNKIRALTTACIATRSKLVTLYGESERKIKRLYVAPHKEVAAKKALLANF